MMSTVSLHSEIPTSEMDLELNLGQDGIVFIFYLMGYCVFRQCKSDVISEIRIEFRHQKWNQHEI